MGIWQCYGGEGGFDALKIRCGWLEEKKTCVRLAWVKFSHVWFCFILAVGIIKPSTLSTYLCSLNHLYASIITDSLRWTDVSKWTYVYRYDDDDEQLMVDKTKLMPGNFPTRFGIEVAA